jgi:hypothetical protein
MNIGVLRRSSTLQYTIKFLLYLKNLNISNMEESKMKTQRVPNKKLSAKKFNIRSKLSMRRWNYLQPTLLQKFFNLLKIFKTNRNLSSVVFGIQKLEIKMKSKRDRESEQQFNELPVIALLMGKTLEYLNGLNQGIFKFTQELFIKNKAIKPWVRRYKFMMFTLKTALCSEAKTIRFCINLRKIYKYFPKIQIRKTKLLNWKALNINIFGFWTWRLLDNVQVNPSSLGLKNLHLEPLNILIKVKTQHKKNTIWNLYFFFWGLGYEIYLQRMRMLVMRYLFSWYIIKSKVLILPLKYSSIFVQKIKKNKTKSKRRKIYINALKKYAIIIKGKSKMFNHIAFKKRLSYWHRFKRTRQVISLTK